jgi:hypothetical protein
VPIHLSFANGEEGTAEAVGRARTDIFRAAPWSTRAMVAVLAPFFSNSIETSVHNAVDAILKGEGSSAFCWDKPGDFEHRGVIQVDEMIRKGIVDVSRKVTGA